MIQWWLSQTPSFPQTTLFTVFGGPIERNWNSPKIFFSFAASCLSSAFFFKNTQIRREFSTTPPLEDNRIFAAFFAPWIPQFFCMLWCTFNWSLRTTTCTSAWSSDHDFVCDKLKPTHLFFCQQSLTLVWDTAVSHVMIQTQKIRCLLSRKWTSCRETGSSSASFSCRINLAVLKVKCTIPRSH